MASSDVMKKHGFDMEGRLGPELDALNGDIGSRAAVALSQIQRRSFSAQAVRPDMGLG